MKSRARGMLGIWVAVMAMICAAGAAMAQPPCQVPHPLKPPDSSFAGRCPNCGMARAMWARTWHLFTDSHGPRQACSMHCLADMAVKSGRPPADVRVALYLSPGTMVPASEAFYVVGSSAAGTMTVQSKPAFADDERAHAFAASCGGRVMRFAEAFSAATAALPAENRMIADRRLKTGKIVVPTDHQDRCQVCEMFAARYPRHRAQVASGKQAPLHFCSTRCLFIYLSRMPVEARNAAMVWVTDTVSGDWISGLTANYVLGSGRLGPMGYEAFAFSERAAAVSFIDSAGKGRVAVIEDVTPGAIAAPQ